MEYQVSCPRFTVWVKTDRSGKIVDAAPIVRRFRGQRLANLKRYAQWFGECRIISLDAAGEEE